MQRRRCRGISASRKCKPRVILDARLAGVVGHGRVNEAVRVAAGRAGEYGVVGGGAAVHLARGAARTLTPEEVRQTRKRSKCCLVVISNRIY